MFMMGLFWIGLLAVAALAARSLFPPREMQRCETGPDIGPLAIARERYARGEISREQFELLRQDLVR
jgi:putative membrane protein